MQGRPFISFVIPAYNEEAYIGATLASIHGAMRPGDAYEVIVVDNGSVDGTPAIASASGAVVLVVRGGTIGALRNAGARRCRGDVLVFIDADVTLTGEWRESFDRAYAELETSPLTVSGSLCSVPSNASWIERTWFAPHNDESLTHIGSAHLVVMRDTFLSVGGFDETLATGEDYEFCHRMRIRGGGLYRLPRTCVEHHGYPKTIRQFVKREMWHGSSDAVSMRAILRSKVAVAALAFVVMHAIALAFIVPSFEAAGGIGVAGILGICAASSVRTYRSAGLSTVIKNVAVYYLYYCGRAASFLRLARQTPRGEAVGDAIVGTSCEA